MYSHVCFFFIENETAMQDHAAGDAPKRRVTSAARLRHMAAAAMVAQP